MDWDGLGRQRTGKGLGWHGGVGILGWDRHGGVECTGGNMEMGPRHPWLWPHALAPITQQTPPSQDQPCSTDGHALDPTATQGIQCDSPKQPAGQESPTLAVPSAVKVGPEPPGCLRQGSSAGDLAVLKPTCCTPRVWELWWLA